MVSAACMVLGFSGCKPANDQAAAQKTQDKAVAQKPQDKAEQKPQNKAATVVKSADEGQKITGIVRQPDGKPAKGIEVKLIAGFGGMQNNVKTDADGKFELKFRHFDSDSGSRFTPCILARDPEHNLAVLGELEEDAGTIDLKLAPGLTLVGRAESNGKPVANIAGTLIFWNSSGNSGMHLNDLSSGTNLAGHFEIPALPPGRKYGVVVSAPGFGQKVTYDVGASAEPGRMELEIAELRVADMKISGHVVDADEKPVEDCQVYISGNDQPNVSARTDSKGRFTFTNICEGSVHLNASSKNSYGNISAESGDTNVVLQLGQTYNMSSDSQSHKLQGTVTGTDGKAAAGVLVSVFPNNGGPNWKKTSSDGAYSLTWSLQSWQQQSGAQLVVRDLEHNLAASLDVSEEVTNLNAKLVPALTCSGLVKKPDGTPLAGAEVEVQIRTGNNYNMLAEKNAVSDAQGRYEIKCLPAECQYMVTISAKGYGNQRPEIPNHSETNRVELAPCVLKIADLVLSGQVVSEDEKPLSGVNVYIYGEGQPNTSLTTDKNGHFSLKVCEGQVRVNASSQNGYAQATAEGGETNLVITLSSRSGNSDQSSRRASLNGKALPDLASLNLPAEAVPTNGAVLLCLFDAGQRPSRHVVNQLNGKTAALKQQGITLLAVQATVTSDETFNSWKSASPVTFPVGRVTDKSNKTKWASSAPSLPMLILTDAKRLVIAEGFALDELDDQVKKLAK